MKRVSNTMTHILYWIIVVASAASELLKRITESGAS